MKLTPADIQNAARKSGFRQVAYGTYGVSNGQGRSGGKPYRAYHGANRKGDWKGPRRSTALEAAQDYCDYVNGDPVRLATVLKRVGKARAPRDPMDDQEVQAALGVLRDARAQRRGRQGYVYLISDGEYVKVGYSVKPEARVSELQTGNARELRLLASMPGTVEDERALHARFIADNLLLEWFRPSAALLSEFGLVWRAGAALFG